MRQLLQETFEEMERREVAISALIPADPWLFDYYREQGYTEAFDYSVETYIRPNTPVQLPEDNGYPTGGTDNRRIVRLFQPQIT